MASFFHRGSVHNESTILVVSAGATALEPPIHKSLVADANIGLGPPTYHPRTLKWWGFIVWNLLEKTITHKIYRNISSYRWCLIFQIL